MGNGILYCQLDKTFTAAIIIRYILQCIMGNYTFVTRNTASRQSNTIDRFHVTSSLSKIHQSFCPYQV